MMASHSRLHTSFSESLVGIFVQDARVFIALLLLCQLLTRHKMADQLADRRKRRVLVNAQLMGTIL
jgi:hypothetical protein